ncbi:MAG: FGGY-family carbohydrate kinase, partial [Lachnospiraceae bacterium]|nr:FGGY-family carbohydrate kinase [Lachnospiraceae bacterium]
SSPAGAKNLLFLPYLLGERSPRWNDTTSGAFLGIKMHHTKEDYLRSVIEGVAYNLELILQAYKKYLTIDSLILTGGGAKGDIICQILADIFETSLHTPNHVEEATSIGAAMVAGVGIGLYDNFESVTKFLDFQKSYVPNLEHKEIYDHLKLMFDRSYYALESVFKDL